MCGIISYIGYKNVSDVLIAGLERLEYRGYDSVGLTLLENSSFKTYKTIGKVRDIKPLVKDQENKDIQLGIGHTRWATHGKPSTLNSHPHESKRCVIVHNGIIENYIDLRKDLISKGYIFVSETDSEVVAHLIDHLYNQNNNPLDTLRQCLAILRGAFALSIMFNDEPDTLYALRSGSPLVIGVGKDEAYIAWDISAFINETHDYIILGEKEIASVSRSIIRIYNEELKEINYTVHTTSIEQDSIGKGSYDHYMLKEIYEQPNIMRKLLETKTPLDLSTVQNIHIIGCGTALHAGYLGKYWIESNTDIRVFIHVASEFRYQKNNIDNNDLLIFISQSGETADTLACLRYVKDLNHTTLAIVNNKTSSLANEADHNIFIEAGFEQSVASTKAYTAQALTLYLLSHEKRNPEAIRIPTLMETLLEDKESIKEITESIKNTKNIFFIGRGLDYAIALEGSLKLKEITYIHSEAIQAGEMKHGTIALIDEEVVTIAIATQTHLLEKTISNVQEILARSGKVILITREDFNIDPSNYTLRYNIPKIDDTLSPLLTMIPLQLLAYYTSLLKGLDVDQPRNLAKSVTVE